MTVQLDLVQVQDALADYLRKRGMIVEPDHIQLEIINHHGTRMSIAGVKPVVIAYDASFPPDDGPFRNAAAGALKP